MQRNMKRVEASPLEFRAKVKGNTIVAKEHREIYLARIAGEQVTREATRFVARQRARGLAGAAGAGKSLTVERFPTGPGDARIQTPTSNAMQAGLNRQFSKAKANAAEG